MFWDLIDRYSGVDHEYEVKILHIIWHIRAIPTYRVYRLYDTFARRNISPISPPALTGQSFITLIFCPLLMHLASYMKNTNWSRNWSQASENWSHGTESSRCFTCVRYSIYFLIIKSLTIGVTIVMDDAWINNKHACVCGHSTIKPLSLSWFIRRVV